MATSPYQELRDEVDRRLGGLLSPILKASLERALGGTGRDGRLQTAIDAAVDDLLKERARGYLAANTVVVEGEGMATIATGRGLKGNGSHEFPATIADVEQLAIDRIARILDQAAALIGKTIDISLEQGSIWTPTTELEFAILNVAPADPASVVTSLNYVSMLSIANPSNQYVLIPKLPATANPGIYRLIMRDSTGAAVDGVLVGSCIPIVLPTTQPDTYYRIDDPLSGGMLLRDTIGEWATIEAQKDVRQGARSRWDGTYKDDSIEIEALDSNIRAKLNRTGAVNLASEELQARIAVAQGDTGMLTFPSGLTIADYSLLVTQIEVVLAASATASPVRLNPQYSIVSQIILLTAENVVQEGPHPINFFVRSVAEEGGAARTEITESIEVDFDLATSAWVTPVVPVIVDSTVFLHVWGIRASKAERFEDLADTPAALGAALSLLQVNDTRAALEFIKLNVDPTAVGGVKLALDRTTAGQMTLKLVSEAAAGGLNYTRYAAFSASGNFVAATWLAGNTSQTGAVTFPATTVSGKKGFAVPADEISLTVIKQVSGFNERDEYLPAVGDPDVLVDINGTSYKTYVSIKNDFPSAFATNFILE